MTTRQAFRRGVLFGVVCTLAGIWVARSTAAMAVGWLFQWLG